MARADASAAETDPSLRALLRRAGLVGRGGYKALGSWSVATQAPEPEQPWVMVDSFRSEDVAGDEVASMCARPGTLALILKGSTPWWLGVAVDGAVVPSPTRPGAPPSSRGATAWLDSWEGREADAQQMISFARACAPPMPVLAACACAAIAVESAKPGPDASDALDLAIRWAGGDGIVTANDLGAASRLAGIAGEGMRGGQRARSALYAAIYACDAAYLAAARGGWNGSCQSAVLAAGSATGGDRKFAAVVRRYVSLGSALAGLIGEE